MKYKRMKKYFLRKAKKRRAAKDGANLKTESFCENYERKQLWPCNIIIS